MTSLKQEGGEKEIDYNFHRIDNGPPVKKHYEPVIGRHIGEWRIISLKEHLARKKQRKPCGAGT